MDAALRRRVIERAQDRCEYCGLAQSHQPVMPFHVEHVVARQHGGGDDLSNLAASLLMNAPDRVQLRIVLAAASRREKKT